MHELLSKRPYVAGGGTDEQCVYCICMHELLSKRPYEAAGGTDEPMFPSVQPPALRRGLYRSHQTSLAQILY